MNSWRLAPESCSASVPRHSRLYRAGVLLPFRMHTARPSRTALLIAKAQILLARDPARRHLVPSTTVRIADACLRASGQRTWSACCASSAFRGFLAWVERHSLPGLVLHFALRKRYIAARVAWAARGGIDQLVVVAAGCDALAARISRFRPGMLAIELDHPATQAVKVAALAGSLGVDLAPCDFTTTTAASVLRAHPRFRVDRRSVFVLEGLVMYLTAEQVRALVEDVASMCAAGSVLVLTWMETRDGEEPRFAASGVLADRWLRFHREPFASGCSREAMAGILTASGFIVDRIADHRTLGRIMPRSRIARGESIVVAVRSDGPTLGAATR